MSLALDVRDALKESSVSARVISIPCWERFDAQDQDYIDQILPSDGAYRCSIEAAATFGWAKYVGQKGRCFGLDRFGASAPLADLKESLGFTAPKIAESILADLKS